MSTLAVTTMVFVCGIVWGGLLALIVFAARSESRKKRGS
jgi:hypothetical protein